MSGRVSYNNIEIWCNALNINEDSIDKHTCTGGPACFSILSLCVWMSTTCFFLWALLTHKNLHNIFFYVYRKYYSKKKNFLLKVVNTFLNKTNWYFQLHVLAFVLHTVFDDGVDVIDRARREKKNSSYSIPEVGAFTFILFLLSFLFSFSSSDCVHQFDGGRCEIFLCHILSNPFQK